MTNKPVKVLVVDDSAFARKVVREMLQSEPSIDVVGAARDGAEALEMVEQLKPDVVICDLVMPNVDGVEFVRRQMHRSPVPILILSSESGDAERAIQAFHAGAVELVQKPSALATDDLRNVREKLIESVLGAAGSAVERLVEPVRESRVKPPSVTSHSKADVVVIGISTGGPQALRKLMPRFPANFPVPIVTVLHMPVGYTALYAETLDSLCALKVKEVREGDLIIPGEAVLAPAGRHLRLKRESRGVVATLTLQPIEKLHRPSVDVLFQSAAEVYQHRVLAIVMTGMGDDGKEGAGWVKAQGGVVLTESEKSCVIYGMPRSVVEAGLSDAAVDLSDLAQAITERI